VTSGRLEFVTPDFGSGLVDEFVPFRQEVTDESPFTEDDALLYLLPSLSDETTRQEDALTRSGCPQVFHELKVVEMALDPAPYVHRTSNVECFEVIPVPSPEDVYAGVVRDLFKIYVVGDTVAVRPKWYRLPPLDVQFHLVPPQSEHPYVSLVRLGETERVSDQDNMVGRRGIEPRTY
jgi:hypothetical protein